MNENVIFYIIMSLIGTVCVCVYEIYLAILALNQAMLSVFFFLQH